MNKLDSMKLASMAAGGMLGAIIGFINDWVWTPPWLLGFITFVFFADWISAIARDCVIANGFSSKKSLYFVMKLVMYWVFMGIVHNIPRVNAEYKNTSVQPFVNGMPMVIYFAILGYTVASVIKNMVLARQMDGKLAKFFNKYIDTYKNPK